MRVGDVHGTMTITGMKNGRVALKCRCGVEVQLEERRLLEEGRTCMWCKGPGFKPRGAQGKLFALALFFAALPASSASAATPPPCPAPEGSSTVLEVEGKPGFWIERERFLCGVRRSVLIEAELENYEDSELIRRGLRAVIQHQENALQLDDMIDGRLLDLVDAAEAGRERAEADAAKWYRSPFFNQGVGATVVILAIVVAGVAL